MMLNDHKPSNNTEETQYKRTSRTSRNSPIAFARISFNACISACAADSIWTIALELFQQMPKQRLEPGAITRNAVPRLYRMTRTLGSNDYRLMTSSNVYT